MFAALAGLLSLVSLVCWVYVLIRMFKEEGAMKGIFGIICGIYAFIWGWGNASRLDAADTAASGRPSALTYRTAMLVWTLCFVGNLVCQGLARA